MGGALVVGVLVEGVLVVDVVDGVDVGVDVLVVDPTITLGEPGTSAAAGATERGRSFVAGSALVGDVGSIVGATTIVVAGPAAPP